MPPPCTPCAQCRDKLLAAKNGDAKTAVSSVRKRRARGLVTRTVLASRVAPRLVLTCSHAPSECEVHKCVRSDSDGDGGPSYSAD
eukprot:scaffold297291_cov32-Tisochrysis_lutea.AAC.1